MTGKTIEEQERAAIMELDGGLPRREAEHRARLIILARNEPQPDLFNDYS